MQYRRIGRLGAAAGDFPFGCEAGGWGALEEEEVVGDVVVVVAEDESADGEGGVGWVGGGEEGEGEDVFGEGGGDVDLDGGWGRG